MPTETHPHPTRYEELARQLTGIGAVKRDLARMLPRTARPAPPPSSPCSTATAKCGSAALPISWPSTSR